MVKLCKKPSRCEVLILRGEDFLIAVTTPFVLDSFVLYIIS